jgi:hypothetical protein
MGQNMKIGPKDMEASFAALTIQGKKGAIELKDLASELSSIAPQWAMFNKGTGVEGVRELGAALQVVKRGFGGDAAETVTGLQSMLTALVKNEKHFRGAGIKMFEVDPKTGAKSMRSVLEIVDEIGKSKLVKNPTLLEKAFGRVEAYRAFLQLTQNKEALDDLISSSRDAGIIQRDLGTYMNSTAGKTSRAWEQMKNAMADVFTPERIKLFSEALVKAVELFGKIVGYIDRTAKFVSDVVDAVRGPSPEERADKNYKHVTAASAAQDQAFIARNANDPAAIAIIQKKNRELARDNFREFAELNAKEGRSDDEQARMLAAQKLAQFYQDKGDPFGGGQVFGPKDDPAAGYDPKVLKHLSKDEFVKAQQSQALAGLQSTIAAAIRDGFRSLDSRPVDVKVGADPVVRATKNAPFHRSRGG